jgi:hypothetical protein
MADSLLQDIWTRVAKPDRLKRPTLSVFAVEVSIGFGDVADLRGC